MDSAMKGLFGGGDEGEVQQKAAEAEDFVKRYQEGDPSEGYSTEEAVEHYKQVAAAATPEQLQKATQQAVSQLTPEQRADFAKMLQQRQTGQVQQREGGEAGVSAGGMGLDDILGSLMGGSTGQTGATTGGGGGLGDILGSLMGGMTGQSGATAQPGATSQTGATAQSGAMSGDSGFDIGAILSSPAAKAVLAGVAAFGMKEIMDSRT
jgi:hypothetical protein